MSFNVFRAVQTAVAHDSLLKKVLTEQKDRNQSLRDLAKNNKKSAESLASWGVRDGDDLGTILTHMQALNERLSSYIDEYANKSEEYRAHLKGIYAREETMDLNRQKRGTLEKKLQSHTKAQKPDVAAIQSEIQLFDRDLAQLEADHMTYKRNSVAMASTVQWDALLELSAKMQIIATFGKYLTEQIPLDRIPPGIQRPPFAGGAVTQQIMQDCQEALDSWQPPQFGEHAAPEEVASPIESSPSVVSPVEVDGKGTPVPETVTEAAPTMPPATLESSPSTATLADSEIDAEVDDMLESAARKVEAAPPTEGSTEVSAV